MEKPLLRTQKGMGCPDLQFFWAQCGLLAVNLRCLSKQANKRKKTQNAKLKMFPFKELQFNLEERRVQSLLVEKLRSLSYESTHASFPCTRINLVTQTPSQGQ